jgi:SAM-dependent methyltransferase
VARQYLKGEMMKNNSLLRIGKYSANWIKEFYDQTGVWWGSESEIPAEDELRARTVNRLGGPGLKRVLDLGCGAGHTAAATAALGHDVTGVDISSTRIQQAKENFPNSLNGPLRFIENDFFTIKLDGQFEVITYWDGFGVQSDADHRCLLRRIANEWLAPGGVCLIEVANTAWVASNTGKEMRLAPLVGVPESVEMLRRWHFDVLHSRWIDEWVPTQHPENALAQTIRCYTPADFILLVEGTGLRVKNIEVNGQLIELSPDHIVLGGPLMTEYCFLVTLVAE